MLWELCRTRPIVSYAEYWVLDTTAASFVFEITGGTEKIDAFLTLMGPIGLAEVSRTGVVALARGSETI